MSTTNGNNNNNNNNNPGGEEKTGEIWSTRIQRELLALTTSDNPPPTTTPDGGSSSSSSSQQSQSPQQLLPSFIKVQDHWLDINAAKCVVTFELEIIKPPKSSASAISSASSSSDDDDDEDEDEEVAKKPMIVVVQLDASMPRKKSMSIGGTTITERVEIIDNSALCYPFVPPKTTLTKGNQHFATGSTIENGDMISMELDWTPSLHLWDAMLHIGLKVKESILQHEPFHPANDDHHHSNAVTGSRSAAAAVAPLATTSTASSSSPPRNIAMSNSALSGAQSSITVSAQTTTSSSGATTSSLSDPTTAAPASVGGQQGGHQQQQQGGGGGGNQRGPTDAIRSAGRFATGLTKKASKSFSKAFSPPGRNRSREGRESFSGPGAGAGGGGGNGTGGPGGGGGGGGSNRKKRGSRNSGTSGSGTNRSAATSSSSSTSGGGGGGGATAAASGSSSPSTPSEVKIGDEINLLEEPWVGARGVYSCKVMRRPQFVNEAIQIASDRADQAAFSSPTAMIRSLTQSAKSVLEEGFLMVTETHIIELKSSKLAPSNGTVVFAISIDLMAKLKFRRQESLSLFFKPSPEDPLVYMCPDSGDAVHQIQTVLKRYGVRGKHTNAAAYRAISEAMQLVQEIQTKELALKHDPTVQRVNEIMDLYRQAAERFELAGDVRHEEVVTHMRKFLARPLTTSILDGSYQRPKQSIPLPGTRAVNADGIPVGEVLERTPAQLLINDTDLDASMMISSTNEVTSLTKEQEKESDKAFDETVDSIVKEAQHHVEAFANIASSDAIKDSDTVETAGSDEVNSNTSSIDGLGGLGSVEAEFDAMMREADKELAELMNA